MHKQKQKRKIFTTQVVSPDLFVCGHSVHTWFNIPKTVENALIKCTFDRFCDKPLKFLKAYKIADLSKYSLPIFLDY